MARRRKNLFNPNSTEPFTLSRSKIENFLRCPRCFYLDRRLGVAEPPPYPFSLNAAVDHLLKKEFDEYRVKQKPHPLMIENKIEAVPFAHPEIDKWRELDFGRGGMHHLHLATNFDVYGGVDDLWVKPDGSLIVVDYKATSKDSEVNLDADWQRSYKNQMEIYQWLFRENGFEVDPVGYFVYANGRRDLGLFNGRLEFAIKLLPYCGATDWIEGTLQAIKQCLLSDLPPSASAACEYCAYRQDAAEALKESKSPNPAAGGTGGTNSPSDSGGQVAFWG